MASFSRFGVVINVIDVSIFLQFLYVERYDKSKIIPFISIGIEYRFFLFKESSYSKRYFLLICLFFAVTNFDIKKFLACSSLHVQ